LISLNYTAMEQHSLDDILPGFTQARPTVVSAAALPPSPPRLRRADRAQMLLRSCALEELLDPDHDARMVWDVVKRWDLSRFLEKVLARGESPGRASTDPLILISLWLYAYTRGISNGRELARLCEEHDAYRWIGGGVSLNYHTLNDFRVEHEKALDELLTQMIAALIGGGLVKVRRISQDGTRVRAGAGRNSFKKKQTLKDHLRQARAHVSAMKRQADDAKMPMRRQKAEQRAARQRVERIEKALKELSRVEAAKEMQKEKPSKHQPAKASMTDPEARLMRMADGGTAPAYNVQFAVATEGRAIVGVEVTNAGSDVQQSVPMRRQVERRTGGKVNEHLMDGGFIGLESVQRAAENNVTVFAPVPKAKKEGVDPHQRKKSDSPAVGAWRVRMGTPEARDIYKERAATVETVNGDCKTYRGLNQFLVRGIQKVKCVALWSALAYNFVQFGRQLLMT
jgi:transposase